MRSGLSTPSRNGAAGVRPARRGFTFIELLVTVVLIGIIMPVAMRCISVCTQVGGQARREMEAASLAKTKLTELIVTGDWESGKQQGQFEEDDWAGYTWAETVTNWTDTSVKLVEVTVSWQSRGRQRGVTVSTLMYPQESST
jgi:prepilin-type N-terminal cleavage/methylation domain-containing protein